MDDIDWRRRMKEQRTAKEKAAAMATVTRSHQSNPVPIKPRRFLLVSIGCYRSIESSWPELSNSIDPC